MLNAADTARIEEIISDSMYVNEKMRKNNSRTYATYLELLAAAMKPGSLTKMQKELIAIGISAHTHCEPCMVWHIREALNCGASDDQILESIEVAIEMGGGPVVARSGSFAFKVMEYYKNKK